MKKYRRLKTDLGDKYIVGNIYSEDEKIYNQYVNVKESVYRNPENWEEVIINEMFRLD